MQYACAAAGGLESLERWHAQPTVRIDDTRRISRFRYACYRAVSHTVTRCLWYVAVVLSTLLCLAVQPRYNMGTTTYTVLFAVQVVLLAFFWFRMLFHMMATGLFGRPYSFFHSFWNWVELVVNVFGILQMIPPTSGIRWMRAVSAARPLQLLLVRAPVARLALAPAARHAPALIDIGLTFALGWLCLATIGTLVLRYRVDSHCYVTRIVHAGSAFDAMTLPALVGASGNGTASLCGLGRACLSPATGFVEVQCLDRMPPPSADSLSLGNADARGVEYYFTYRNLGTALLQTLRTGTVDDLPQELERWMVLRGSGAALFPVSVVLLVGLAVTAMLAVYSAAYAAAQRPALKAGPHGNDALFRTALELDTGDYGGGDVDTSHAYAHAHRGRANTDHALPSKKRAADRAKVSASTQTAVPSRAAPGHSLVEELSSSRRDHESMSCHAHGGNPFALDDPTDLGPFVLSCTEEQLPEAAVPPVLSPSFMGTWSRSGLAAAMRGQMQTIHFDDAHLDAGIASLARRIESPAFVVFHVLFMVANVVLLAIHLDTFTSRAGRILMQTSAALSLVLLLHALFILLAYGPRHFALCGWHLVEVFGGVTGILELAAPGLFQHYVVRGIRILRVIPLIQYTSPFALIRESWPALVHIALAAAAMVALYTLVGMQIFSEGHSLVSSLQANFETVWTGLLSTFIAATADDWSTAMLAAFRLGRVAPAVLFYVSLLFWSVFVSRIVLVSVLAAALHRRLLTESTVLGPAPHSVPPLLLLPPVAHALHDQAEAARADVSRANWDSPFTAVVVEGLRDEGNAEDEKGHREMPAPPRHARRARWCAWLVNPSVGTLASLFSSSALYIVPSHAALRLWLVRLFSSLLYHVLMYLTVVMGVVALFFETTVSHQPFTSARRQRALYIINIVYMVVFWLEMLLKCVAYGVLRSESAGFIPSCGAPTARHRWGAGLPVDGPPVPYLRHPLNWLDVAANGLAMGGIFYAPLRLGRVLRSARLCTTPERPNRTFLAALEALLACARLVPFLVVLYVVFALLGLSFFCGRLGRCVTDTALTTKDACNAAGAVWSAGHFHYSHFGHALLSVFAVSVTHHWTPFMADGMGVGDVDTTPQGSQAGYYVIFFLGIVLVVRYVAHGVMMAMLAAQYALRRGQAHTSAVVMQTVCAASAPLRWWPWWSWLLAPRLGTVDVESARQRPTRADGRWLGAEYAALLAPDCWPQMGNALSRACHRLLTFRVPAAVPTRESRHALAHTRSLCEWSWLALTFVVCGFVAASFAYPSEKVTRVFLAFDCVGVVVLGLEVVLRAVAYGVRHFQRLWYVVDVAVFALFIVGMCVPDLTFLRALLLVRLVRMSGLSMSLYPLGRRAWSLLNALSVYLMLLLIFSVVATQLFGDLHLEGSTLTTKQNFRTVIGAYLMLFTCSTSSNWAELVAACAQDPRLTGCDQSSDDSKCGSVSQSVTFFVVFGVAVQLLALPLCLVSLVDTSALASDGHWSHAFHRLQCLWRALTVPGDLSPVPVLSVLPAVHAVVTRMDAAEPRTSAFSTAHRQSSAASDTATVARLRLTVDGEGRLAYTQLVKALLRYHWGILNSDLSWFSSCAARTAAADGEIAAKVLARLSEQERQTRATAEWLPSDTDALLWRGARHTRGADDVDGVDVDAMDASPEVNAAGRRLRGADLIVPTRTQPLPGSSLFLFNID